MGEGETGTDAKEEGSREESKDSDERQQDFGPDYSYDPGGTLIYTNPESKQQFVLNEAKTDWVPKDGSGGGVGAAAEKDKYAFDGETYSYKDDATGKRFKWDLEKKEWKEVGRIKVDPEVILYAWLGALISSCRLCLLLLIHNCNQC